MLRGTEVVFTHDRADFGEPVKCLARSLAKPTPGSLRDLKKVARYLLGTKHMAFHLFRQTFSKQHVDSDFVGCRSTHRSTTGMVQMWMSTGEFIRVWYCRGCWIDWNAQDDDANVNTVDEQELGASRCWSGLKWNRFSNLRFADDVMLRANSLTQLRKMTTDFKRSTERQVFKIPPGK